jgi:hypothetical protein
VISLVKGLLTAYGAKKLGCCSYGCGCLVVFGFLLALYWGFKYGY